MSLRLAPLYLAVVTTVALGLGPAVAQQGHPEGMHVHGAYARATPQAGAIYFMIHNHTDTEDAIISVSTDVADKAELHSQAEDANGVMQMRALPDGLPLPPGEMVELSRGGNHIMLMGLKKSLADGEAFNVTLRFASAAPVEVKVTVDNARKADAGMEGMDHDAMPHDHGEMHHDEKPVDADPDGD